MMKHRGTRRRGGRFADMFRRNPYRWGGLGLAVLFAALVGVQLGQSAVAGINPIYFQGAAVHPRDRGAAIDPATVQPAQASYFQAYGWEDGNAARLAACPDCGPHVVGDTYSWSDHAPPRVAGPNWRDATPVTELQPWEPGRTTAEGHREVLRYADFPIEEEEAVEQPAAEDYQAEDVYEE